MASGYCNGEGVFGCLQNTVSLIDDCCLKTIYFRCWMSIFHSNDFYFYYEIIWIWGFLGGSAVKNPPARQEMWETPVWSLGGEDPLEEGMATHYSILAWRIPWTEEAGGLQSMGLQRGGHDWVTSLSLMSILLMFGKHPVLWVPLAQVEVEN